MRTTHVILKRIAKLELLLILVASMSACAGFLGFGTTWKEEVLQHDGSKIMVIRSQTHGGRHEIGQSSPVKEHHIRFSVPSTDKTYTWVSEYGEDVGRTNFNLLALHVLNGIPYLVVEPNLCLSYNKWGRPNPPYVFFKHNGKEWQRIPLSEFPEEFKTINVVVNNGNEDHLKRFESKLGYISAEGVQVFNSSLRQPEYKTILREAVNESALCPEWIYFESEKSWVTPSYIENKKRYQQLKLKEQEAKKSTSDQETSNLKK